MVKKPRSGDVEQKRRAGKVTSAKRTFRPHGVNAASGYISGDIYDSILESDYYVGVGSSEPVYGGGDPEDEGRLAHYAAKGLRRRASPGLGKEEALSGYFNAGNDEHEREWVSRQQGELLADIEEAVGGFRSGLGWPGTYRYSERAIVRRAIKRIPEEVYQEEE